MSSIKFNTPRATDWHGVANKSAHDNILCLYLTKESWIIYIFFGVWRLTF